MQAFSILRRIFAHLLLVLDEDLQVHVLNLLDMLGHPIYQTARRLAMIFLLISMALEP